MAEPASPLIKPPDKQKLLTRLGALKAERASFYSTWKDISTYLLPHMGRFFVSDHNRGGRRDTSIIDSSGTRNLRILGAGMMAGATSPARPWFRIRTPDPDLNEFHSVKLWLSMVTNMMRDIFAKSNTYRALHQIYEELGGFGTGCDVVLHDFEKVIHHYTLTTGEYYIYTDFKGRVCGMYREFERPVSEIVKHFGYDNCSTTVKSLYTSGTLDSWVPLIHVIEPRVDRDYKKANNKNFPWGSYYFEQGSTENKFLRESGFRDFPVLAPRWAVIGGDIYGNGPGEEALGDVKQLQHEQLRKGQGIDYKTKPPMQAPVSMKNREMDMLPGGVSWYDPAQGGNAGAPIKNLFDVNMDLSHLLEDIRDVRERIRSAFYADLFLMLANATDTRMTATEVAERHEEKLLMLGPVLERLHNELLDPLIEITFARMMEAGIIPIPPEELNNMELNVEFVSMLAQAQKAIGANSIDRWMGAIGTVASFKPDIVDKVDTDYFADAYGDMLGVDPKLIVANEKAALIRNKRAETVGKAQEAEVAEQQSKTIKNLAGAPMNGNNALTNVMDNLTGYNTPGVLK